MSGVTINGVTYSAAEEASLKKSGLWNFIVGNGATGAAGSTGTQILLPNATILEQEGVPKKLAEQYGLKPLNIPATGLNGTTLSLSAGLKTAIDSLPKELIPVVENRLGFNDTRLGKTLSERITAILPVLQAAQGHIGNIDLNLALANSTVASMQKTLGQYAQALSSGNQAALIGATASAKYSAEANADNTLTNWNLDTPEMNKLVSNMVANGVTNVNEILQNIRQTQTYKQAFPGLTEYNSQPGVPHMTEAEYRSYQQAIQGAAQQYGQVKLNNEQIAGLLKGNVSPAEFQQRVQDIGVAVANADPGTKKILQQQFGIDPAHIFAYYANPKEALPDMQRAVASGEIQDYANRVGLGGLKPAGAGQLADMAKLSATQGNNPLGVGVSNIENSLLSASRDVGLTAANPGDARPPVNTNTLIGSQLAGFGGTNQVAAQTEVARAEQAKAAPFERGGGYDQTAKGVVGVGAAST